MLLALSLFLPLTFLSCSLAFVKKDLTKRKNTMFAGSDTYACSNIKNLVAVLSMSFLLSRCTEERAHCNIHWKQEAGMATGFTTRTRLQRTSDNAR
ncbi:hypothetical protein P389DRAFT_172045 [Cystobasidium minutum MCA 4210]|uniref:uncharacterized protein n=1 Tax=Cystobasidium minutum MCA 4210 TaxID=1397322 RepID=UPI0034CD9151|eukprot:jgi/Rhomi1/172045/fgenesh1_kg.4_\